MGQWRYTTHRAVEQSSTINDGKFSGMDEWKNNVKLIVDWEGNRNETRQMVYARRVESYYKGHILLSLRVFTVCTLLNSKRALFHFSLPRTLCPSLSLSHSLASFSFRHFCDFDGCASDVCVYFIFFSVLFSFFSLSLLPLHSRCWLCERWRVPLLV